MTRQIPRNGALALFALLVFGVDLDVLAEDPALLLADGRDGCPDGQVLVSPGHCSFKNLCPDGSLPGKDGRCYAADVPQRPAQVPVTNRSCKTQFRRSDPPRSGGGCSERRHVAPRKVFLANGDAGRVFEKYLRDAEDANVTVDLERLTVFFVSGGAQRKVEAPKLKLGATLSGKSARDLWVKALGDVVAEPRENAAADADQLEADAACGD